MTEKHPKRPRDTNQLAKRILDLATGEVEEKTAAKKAAKEHKAPKHQPNPGKRI